MENTICFGRPDGAEVCVRVDQVALAVLSVSDSEGDSALTIYLSSGKEVFLGGEHTGFDAKKSYAKVRAAMEALSL